MSFLLGFPLSIVAAEAILASSGNIPCLKLLLIATVKGLERKSAKTLTSFGELKLKLIAFLMFINPRVISMNFNNVFYGCIIFGFIKRVTCFRWFFSRTFFHNVNLVFAEFFNKTFVVGNYTVFVN